MIFFMLLLFCCAFLFSPRTICLCVCRHVNVFIHMWLCWYVMQVQLRFCRCKCEGKAKFFCLKTSVNQGSLAGTHVGKWTAVVKIVEIFQTKYLWSMVNWQLNPPNLEEKEEGPASSRGMRCQGWRGKPIPWKLTGVAFDLLTMCDYCNIFQTMPLGVEYQRSMGAQVYKIWNFSHVYCLHIDSMSQVLLLYISRL